MVKGNSRMMEMERKYEAKCTSLVTAATDEMRKNALFHIQTQEE